MKRVPYVTDVDLFLVYGTLRNFYNPFYDLSMILLMCIIFGCTKMQKVSLFKSDQICPLFVTNKIPVINFRIIITPWPHAPIDKILLRTLHNILVHPVKFPSYKHLWTPPRNGLQAPIKYWSNLQCLGTTITAMIIIRSNFHVWPPLVGDHFP